MNDKKKNILIIGLIVLAFILIGTAIGLFIKNKSKNVNIYDEVEIYEDPAIEELITTDDSESERNLQNELIALNATYSDAVGYLKIAGTNIDTPVYQAKDNNRYLRNDKDGNATSWGETFLDYDSKVDFSGYTNLVIYGHNTTTDDHFTPLTKYLSKEFYDANKIIEFSTLEGNYKWAIFSVFKTTADNYEDFYIDTNFNNDAEFEQFVTYFKNKSIYDTGVSVNKNDDILTLSTCEYSQNNGRLVVMARRVRN